MIVKKFNESLDDDKFKKYVKTYQLDNISKLRLYSDIQRLNKFEIKFDMFYYIMNGKDIFLAINAYLESSKSDFILKGINFTTNNDIFSVDELEKEKEIILNSEFWTLIEIEDVDQLIDSVKMSNKFNI